MNSILLICGCACITFCGGVRAGLVRISESGPVKVTATLSPEKPVIGDEVTLEIVVEAEKNVEVLMPEFGEALERYTILDFVPRQRVSADGSQLLSQKYTLQPILSGEQAIPPILIEFVDRRPGSKPTPDDFDAYELLTERIDFTVQSVVPHAAGGELKPPLGELDLEGGSRSRFPWIAGLLVTTLVLLASIVFLARQRRTRVRKQNAYQVARNRLDRLLADRNTASPNLSIEQFFVEISSLIRRYLEDRYELRAPELTTDEFLLVAGAHSELSREHQLLLSEFLSQADVVKFAGVSASEADVARSGVLAARFLEETRENAPDVDVSDAGETDARELTNVARGTQQEFSTGHSEANR